MSESVFFGNYEGMYSKTFSINGDNVAYCGVEFNGDDLFKSLPGSVFFSIYYVFEGYLDNEQLRMFSKRMNVDAVTILEAVLLKDALLDINELYNNYKVIDLAKKNKLIVSLLSERKEGMSSIASSIHDKVKSYKNRNRGVV